MPSTSIDKNKVKSSAVHHIDEKFKCGIISWKQTNKEYLYIIAIKKKTALFNKLINKRPRNKGKRRSFTRIH